MIRTLYVCDLCGFQDTNPMDFYGMSHTVHQPPLNRKVELPESKNACAHICGECVDLIKLIDRPQATDR